MPRHLGGTLHATLTDDDEHLGNHFRILTSLRRHAWTLRGHCVDTNMRAGPVCRPTIFSSNRTGTNHCGKIWRTCGYLSAIICGCY